MPNNLNSVDNQLSFVIRGILLNAPHRLRVLKRISSTSLACMSEVYTSIDQIYAGTGKAFDKEYSRMVFNTLKSNLVTATGDIERKVIDRIFNTTRKVSLEMLKEYKVDKEMSFNSLESYLNTLLNQESQYIQTEIESKGLDVAQLYKKFSECANARLILKNILGSEIGESYIHKGLHINLLGLMGYVENELTSSEKVMVDNLVKEFIPKILDKAISELHYELTTENVAVKYNRKQILEDSISNERTTLTDVVQSIKLLIAKK